MNKQPLDFRVLEQPVMTLDPEGRPFSAPKWKSLVREDNGEPLAIVNSTYQVVQFPDLIEHVEDQIRKALPNQQFEATQKASFGGKVGHVEYVFPDVLAGTPQSSQAQVKFRLIVSNSFGWERVKLIAGAIDSFCSNGMIFGEYTSAFWKHTKRLDIHAQLTGQIDKCVKTYVSNAEQLKGMMVKPATRAQVHAFFDALPVSDRRREALQSRYFEEDAAMRGETAWAVFSTLTYYASHNSNEFPIRETGRDHYDNTLLKRQQEVARWTKLPEWEELSLQKAA